MDLIGLNALENSTFTINTSLLNFIQKAG
jgi:hypothetical protein